MDILAEAMTEGKILDHLEALNLSCNALRAAGAKIIANKIIKGNNVLKQLDLFSNLFETEGTKFIAEALSENTTLEILDLGKNKTRDKGLVAVLEAISSNPDSKLRVLGVRKNLITDQGFHQISNIILNEGTSVKRLLISANSINKYNLQKFDKVMMGKGIYIDILENEWQNEKNYLKRTFMIS